MTRSQHRYQHWLDTRDTWSYTFYEFLTDPRYEMERFVEKQNWHMLVVRRYEDI